MPQVPNPRRRSLSACALATLVFSTGLLWVSSTHAGSSAESELSAQITAAMADYNQCSDQPMPVLTAEQLKDLVKGKVVKVRRGRSAPPPGLPAGERPERIYGLMLMELPRTELWVAALDPDFTVIDILKELRLASAPDGSAIWYQFLSLPWPIADRHWTVELRKLPALADSTHGLAWEQRWRLADNGLQMGLEAVAAGKVAGLTNEQAAKAVYTPVNEGSWTALALTPSRTLLIYYESTSVGGNISDELVADFATATLDQVFHAIAKRTPTVSQHYTTEHEPIIGGDGKPIPALAPRTP